MSVTGEGLAEIGYETLCATEDSQPFWRCFALAPVAEGECGARGLGYDSVGNASAEVCGHGRCWKRAQDQQLGL